ncbi:hypothetical protein EV198_0909 [Roseivirga ehrenbergii]|uniref:Uncharacterized protein n=1 Tax=Roseivirga ehrenbergii (strain DSM 102268 / JCM 13514 / KCTC 12282 / NCIMB 14502 / KMM 6017) TaxID=279360 RepID=A0A150X795_ROSEK|nr:hypothetical protein [Roseivirga ehrenbergii]KYG74609.1 hypothetical protein MB14_05215 [Roseivirga ehrenbergii]TCL14073.1 hypothetical protein EV198_0909 [Roseivirga ehrenbergii]
MATDGVKIIDGDLARDTYDRIMDLYDSDANIETIRKEVPFVKDDYGPNTDFYYEIFVTTYALAFWEIGEITNEMLNEVKRVTDLKAGVKIWTEECDDNEGKKRQNELDKLLKKISEPNQKIRKRKKYKLRKNFYFQPDDILTFQLSDKNYYAVICAKVTQQRGQCTYGLVATTYKGKTKPTIDELKNYSIAGLKIGSGYDSKTTLSEQPNVDEIWRYTKQDNFFFGLSYHLVTHRDIITFKDKFEVVGKLKIKESFKKDGGYGYESSFDRFESIFDDLDNHMKVFGEQKFPVTLLCEI